MMKNRIFGTGLFRMSARRKAAALLLTLGSVALLSLFVVALLSSSARERRSSIAFDENLRTAVLAETPVNLVIGQIRAATEPTAKNQTWASQPGMLRVFGTQAAGGATRARVERVHRLYSAPSLISDSTFNAANEEPPAGWASQVAQYVDLNEPVKTADGRTIYPIVTPPPTTGTAIPGYTIEGAPTSGTDNRAPMPVTWMYVTEDGRYLTPSSGTGSTVTFDSSIVNDDNRIIGRIAFWTDDESTKVNVNTANEGVFWTPPYCLNRTERCNTGALSDAPVAPYGYAMSMPLRNEFQRYPGHPANTSLSRVFLPWLPVSNPPTPEELTPYGILSPRIENGGSKGGNLHTGNGANVKLVALDQQRLYPAVDELYFSTVSRTPGSTVTARTPFSEVVAKPAFNRDALDQVKFLLTAHSRSPETNLFNQPKVSVWPVMKDVNYRNAIDKLLAFCATVNGREYFWRRGSHWTSYSSPGSGQSPTEEPNEARNRAIYDMIMQNMERPIPGFGTSTFSSKYGNDSPQIITGIFDYIRSQVSTVPSPLPPNYWYSPARPNWSGLGAAAPGEGQIVPLKITHKGVDTMGAGRFITITEAALVLYAARDGTNAKVPLGKAKQVRAMLMLEQFSPSIGHPSWSPNYRVVVRGMENFRFNAQDPGFPSEMSIVGEVPTGYFDGEGHVSAAHTGMWQLFQRYTSGSNSSANGPRTLGSDERNNYTLYGRNSIPIPDATNTIQFQPVGNGDITLEIRTADSYPGTLIQTIQMNFPASTWPVPINTNNTPGKFTFSTDETTNAEGGGDYTDFNWRINENNNRMKSNWTTPARVMLAFGDVVRSVEADYRNQQSGGILGGDLRLLSYSPVVSKANFVVHPSYHQQASPYFAAHSLRNDKWNYKGQVGWLNQSQGNGDLISGVDSWEWAMPTWWTGGSIVKNRVHFRDNTPVVARGLNGAYRSDGKYGDWETGYGTVPDGSYIRKIGEGSALTGRYGDGGFYWNIEWSVAGGTGNSVSGGADNNALFMPNREMVSPIQFGAVPSGIKASQPFQTLLFAPNPNGRATEAISGGAISEPTDSDHKGFGLPRDHLLLENFWMPAVEPYAISEPLATAGKINMNYEIMPFRYIKRRTPIHALLNTVKVAAMPEEIAQGGWGGGSSYKQGHPTAAEIRYEVNLDPVDGTLRGFEERFKNGDIFRSASEICSIFLVPKRKSTILPNMSYYGVADPKYDNVVNWWKSFPLTGDNMREDPYSHIYPRLTTRSNVYRVHYRVQLLGSPRSVGVSEWNEDRGQILSEQRGSTLIERYIDPNDSTLPDFATSTGVTDPVTGDFPSVDKYYRFRIIRSDRFSP